MIYPERDITSSRAHDFIVDLDELQSTLKEEITKAQRQYQPSANTRCQQPPDFQVRQSVFIKSQYFQMTCPSKKLFKKYLGPYEIIAQPSLQFFTLCLLNTIRAIHPVFYHWQRTRIQDLQDSRLQDWPLEGMQTAIQGYMARIQRYRQ